MGAAIYIRAGLRYESSTFDRSLITVAQYIFGIIWIKCEKALSPAGRPDQLAAVSRHCLLTAAMETDVLSCCPP